MPMNAEDKNMEIENVVVQYRDRPEGSESKLNTVGDGIKVLFTIINFYRIYRPLQFFSGLSLVMIIVAFAFFVPVFASFLRTHTVTKIPTLVVCGFVALASIQSFFSGMILNSLKQKERQDFEIRLHRVTRSHAEAD